MKGIAATVWSSCPFEVILSSTDLEMILRDAEIQLGIANQREASFGDYLGRLVVFGGYIFKEELLLVHSCRGK